jgi:hypothetical protein
VNTADEAVDVKKILSTPRARAYLMIVLGLVLIIISPLIWLAFNYKGFELLIMLIGGVIFIISGFYAYFRAAVRPVTESGKSGMAPEQRARIDKERREMVRAATRRYNAVFLALITLFGVAAVAEYLLNIGGMVFYLTVFMVVSIAAIAILRTLMAPVYVKNWREYVVDERVKKIDAHARASAWAVTLAIVVILLVLYFVHIEIGTYFSLMIIFLATTYSWFAFKWYYGRKGDVE